MTTTLSQIAENAGWAEGNEDAVERTIRALIDTPWGCPSPTMEEVYKSGIRKYVLGVDDG